MANKSTSNLQHLVQPQETVTYVLDLFPGVCVCVLCHKAGPVLNPSVNGTPLKISIVCHSWLNPTPLFSVVLWASFLGFFLNSITIISSGRYFWGYELHRTVRTTKILAFDGIWWHILTPTTSFAKVISFSINKNCSLRELAHSGHQVPSRQLCHPWENRFLLDQYSKLNSKYIYIRPILGLNLLSDLFWIWFNIFASKRSASLDPTWDSLGKQKVKLWLSTCRRR